MHTTLQEPVGPELQRIGDIHRDAARIRLDVLPPPLRRFDLQCGHGLREEQRQTAKIGVSARIQVLVPGVFLSTARAVYHVAQMAVAVPRVAVAVEEGALGDFEDDGDQSQELVHDVLVDVAMEALDFGPMALDHVRVRALVLRDELEDVVHLHIVAPARQDLDGA